MPTCPRCKTDDYLLYSNFVPAHDETRHIATHLGQRVTRTTHRSPVVEYRCQKCGHFNGHAVPDGWTVPTPNPKIQLDRPNLGPGIVWR